MFHDKAVAYSVMPPTHYRKRDTESEAWLLQAGSYTNYFADALIAEAELDSRVVGIHAAMGGGTGMNRFEQRFPERTFDVGIAEQVRACSLGSSRHRPPSPRRRCS